MTELVRAWRKQSALTIEPLAWQTVNDWQSGPDEEDKHSDDESEVDEKHQGGHDDDNSSSSSTDGSDSCSSGKEDTVSISSFEEEAIDAIYERDRLLYPRDEDQLVFRVLDRYEPMQMLLNKVGRKVFVMRARAEPKELVVVTCHKDYLPELQKQNVPREIRILQRLKGAAHISQLKEWAFVAPDLFVSVVPFYHSFELRKAIVPSCLYLVAKFMTQLLTAIQVMHERKVVHRDVAVDNITWDPVTEQLRLIDFDCATFDRPAGFTANVGRDDYYAPEMAKAVDRLSPHAEPYDKRVDVYAAGVVFFMVLTNNKHPPSHGALRKYLKGIRKRKNHKKYPHMNLLESMLRYDRDDRISLDDALKHAFLTETAPDEAYQKLRSKIDKALEVPVSNLPAEGQGGAYIQP